MNQQQDHDEWDYDNAVVQSAQPLTSVVYSVRFAKQEIDAIRKAASEAGITVSEFIRAATHERLEPTQASGQISVAGGAGLHEPGGLTTNGVQCSIRGSIAQTFPTGSEGVRLALALG